MAHEKHAKRCYTHLDRLLKSQAKSSTVSMLYKGICKSELVSTINYPHSGRKLFNKWTPWRSNIWAVKFLNKLSVFSLVLACAYFSSLTHMPTSTTSFQNIKLVFISECCTCSTELSFWNYANPACLWSWLSNWQHHSTSCTEAKCKGNPFLDSSPQDTGSEFK